MFNVNINLLWNCNIFYFKLGLKIEPLTAGSIQVGCKEDAISPPPGIKKWNTCNIQID